MEIFTRDTKKAFENAIVQGLKADEYMYMYSDKELKKDFFKHIMTREYISFSYSKGVEDESKD